MAEPFQIVMTGPPGIKGDTGDVTAELQTLHDEAKAFRDGALVSRDASTVAADAAATSASVADAESTLATQEKLAAAASANTAAIHEASAANWESLAAAAAASAEALTRLVPDTTAGLATTTNGQYFSVIAGNELIIYRNVTGSAVEQVRRTLNLSGALISVTTSLDGAWLTDEYGHVVLTLSPAEFDTLKISGAQISRADLAGYFSWTDEFGHVAVEIDGTGAVHINDLRGTFSTSGEATGQSWADKFGHVVAWIDAVGVFHASAITVGNLIVTGSSSTGGSAFTLGEKASYDRLAMALSYGDRQKPVFGIQRLTAKYNHVIITGQSLAQSAQGTPPLSTSGLPGTLSLGTKEHPSNLATDPFWTPSGSSAFQTLVASSVGAQVLGQPLGFGLAGESPAIMALRWLKRRLDAALQTEDATARNIVVTNTAVGQTAIEEWAKGATPNIYLRNTSAAAQVKAVAASDSYRFVATVWLLGENNYQALNGSADKTVFKTKVGELIDNFNSDIAVAISGQGNRAGFFLGQTGASWTRDDNNLSIGMAEWELSRERDDVFMVGPYYPLTDRLGHLDANGYRWFGAYYGKAMEQVLVRGLQWAPLAPAVVAGIPQILVRGKSCLILLSVPVPPVRFAQPYQGSVAVDASLKGFVARDGSGDLPIASVTLEGSCLLELIFSRFPSGTVHIRHAGKTTYDGLGYICDSDPAKTVENYTYVNDATLMAPAENIPALVDKPYPLPNWFIAFDCPAVAV